MLVMPSLKLKHSCGCFNVQTALQISKEKWEDEQNTNSDKESGMSHVNGSNLRTATWAGEVSVSDGSRDNCKIWVRTHTDWWNIVQWQVHLHIAARVITAMGGSHLLNLDDARKNFMWIRLHVYYYYLQRAKLQLRGWSLNGWLQLLKNSHTSSLQIFAIL